MAHKKGLGSSKNGRDSNEQYGSADVLGSVQLLVGVAAVLGGAEALLVCHCLRLLLRRGLRRGFLPARPGLLARGFAGGPSSGPPAFAAGAFFSAAGLRAAGAFSGRGAFCAAGAFSARQPSRRPSQSPSWARVPTAMSSIVMRERRLR